MAIDQEQLLNKYSQALVRGEYPIRAFRFILDRQSGIPGIPGIEIFEPEGFKDQDVIEMLRLNPRMGIDLTPEVSLTDGTVTLTPRLVKREVLSVPEVPGGRT